MPPVRGTAFVIGGLVLLAALVGGLSLAWMRRPIDGPFDEVARVVDVRESSATGQGRDGLTWDESRVTLELRLGDGSVQALSYSTPYMAPHPVLGDEVAVHCARSGAGLFDEGHVELLGLVDPAAPPRRRALRP